MHDVLADEDFVKEMNSRMKEMDNGEVKAYTWDEVKEIIRKSLSEIKRQ